MNIFTEMKVLVTQKRMCGYYFHLPYLNCKKVE
jgi:hypothetical protein